MKRRIECPECGHRHTITINGVPTATAGVRARRVTGNQFEYSLTAPQNLIEAERFTGVTDDLILSGAFGVAFGAMIGAGAAAIAPDYAPPLIAFGISGGTAVAWGWLCAEHNQRLKRVLPWFVAKRAEWEAGQAQARNEGPTLTIDHRYRDGQTEAGRTIQYFGTLPVNVERFNEWARAALRGDSLAIAQWTGQENPFSRQEYDRLLTVLRQAGTVINVPGKGNQLTGGGRRALKRHLKQEGINDSDSA